MRTTAWAGSLPVPRKTRTSTPAVDAYYVDRELELVRRVLDQREK
jgi:hypothetical protein